jgi:CO/xanthine dehydrogenase Mo-binding subunit
MLAEKPSALSDARRLTQRVHFERDGTVSIASGKVELGQGILTAFAQIAAEELGVPLERIRMLPASTAHSPDEGVTSGSQSISEGGKALRKACAEMRALLERSGKKSYWELELDAEIPGDAQEKKPAEYRVVGTSAPRRDLPAKFAGKPSYVHDMVLPGMLHGRVVRPSHGFSRLKALGEVQGVTVVRDGSFVGVLAEREEDAIAAAAKLRAKSTWEQGATVPQDIHAWLKQHVAERNISKEVVDAQARALGTRQLRAAYTKPYICHASIGPSCAIAQWHERRLEVWTHSQGIFGLRQDLAMVLGMKPEDIVVTHVEGAGCYGHNGADDVALDAALLARGAGGRPVKVQWMREDEFAWEPYGAAMSMDLQAGLDAGGTIVSWRHDLWSNGHTNRPGRSEKPALIAAAHLAEPFELCPAFDPPLPAGGAQRNALPIYAFPDLRVAQHYVREAPLRSSSLRSLGAFGNVFAIESFMDECAAAAGSDPLAFRLRHLRDERARAVLDLAVVESGWTTRKRPEGRGHGLALARYKNMGAYCAVVAEVEAGKELRVTRLVAAVDAGLVINPDGLANQVEGGCVQAASWALKEELRPGAVSWEDYPILTFSEAPRVEVHLIASSLPSLGAGECMMGPTAGAIANALHDALGVRVRELPLTPERVLNAIEAARAKETPPKP